MMNNYDINYTDSEQTISNTSFTCFLIDITNKTTSLNHKITKQKIVDTKITFPVNKNHSV